MKKLILSMFALVACTLGALAQGFPTVSIKRVPMANKLV